MAWVLTNTGDDHEELINLDSVRRVTLEGDTIYAHYQYGGAVPLYVGEDAERAFQDVYRKVMRKQTQSVRFEGRISPSVGFEE